MINDMTVGMENLPNVFIDNIRIEPHVGYETRATEISSLNNGAISLFNHNPLDDFYYRPSIRSLGGSVTALGLEGEYEKYSIRITKLTRKTNNLNIYAACFVDGFGFNNPIFDKFYGPMAAEQVYVGGQLNTLSNYFYYPESNEEYGGPVHQKPNGSYMEGSVHTEDPHKEVVMVTEENYKIQAFNTSFDLSDEVFANMTFDSNFTNPSLSNQIFDGVIGVGTDIRPGSVDAGEDTSGNTTGVSVEDPNVPSSTPDGIY